MTHIKNTFKNCGVDLDNTEFIECRFEDCKMIYSALGPVGMTRCTFSNVKWEFKGGAANTIQFLKGMYHGMGEGGRKVVEATFAGIRKP
jgi:hypothetical protein